jgi:pilus assembly protein FimV
LPDAPTTADAPAAPAEPGLEFDLGSLTLDAPSPAAEAPAAAPTESEPALDLGNFDLGAPAEAPPSGGDDVIELGSEISMDTPAGDESSTKLDLARAYIDMGDSDMAKSLLNEVAQQGNAEQQKEAQELLKRVSG